MWKGINMKCRRNVDYYYLILSKDTAKECLEKMGFGEELCKKTYEKDGRYGIIYDDCIKYGWEDKVNGKIKFGTYVVFDAGYDGYGQDICDEKEFYKIM
jgi:hypothetical protein